MKLYEKHERRWQATYWTGRYKRYAVRIAETVGGAYWFFCELDGKSYNSLVDDNLYKTRDAAEDAVIKYIDDETEKEKK